MMTLRKLTVIFGGTWIHNFDGTGFISDPMYRREAKRIVELYPMAQINKLQDGTGRVFVFVPATAQPRDRL